MACLKMFDNIYFVGVKDWDRRFFDELIPLPEGTSYNSYIIKGSNKTAIIDTVDPVKEKEFFDNIAKSGVKKIDYIVTNHAEQDHSGLTGKLLQQYPDALVVTNTKCRDFSMDLLHIPDKKFLVIKDGEELSLGNKTLKFYLTPWVHWPETMITYLVEDKILFSCDFFGSHLATSDFFVENEYDVYNNAKRYFAEIMLPFRTQIRKNIEIVEKLDVKYICPSHGPTYKNPKMIIDAYKDWISDNVKKEVLIPYISMHESTEVAVNYIVNKLIEKNIKVIPFNLSKTDIGELAMALVDASTIIVGTPTVLAGPHPIVVNTLYLANALRPKTKYLGIVGSFGWGGKTVDIIKGMVTNFKAELFEPVLIKGLPKDNDYKLLDELVTKIVEANKS